jgi:hypothetical protein
MIVTVTGTRHHVSRQQCDWVWETLTSIGATEMHQGACTGFDEYCHMVGLKLGLTIVVHPPNDGRWMMQPDWNHENVTVLPAAPYHERDRNMVDASAFVLGAPLLPRNGTSGTWYTLDYAAYRRRGGQVCYPDGRVEPLDVACAQVITHGRRHGSSERFR